MPRYKVVAGGRMRPRYLAKLVSRDLDEHHHPAVVLYGTGPCRAVDAVCRIAAPVFASDSSGTTRPWHPIIKETDRGNVTNATAADVPWELELRRVTTDLPDRWCAVIDDGAGCFYIYP